MKVFLQCFITKSTGKSSHAHIGCNYTDHSHVSYTVAYTPLICLSYSLSQGRKQQDQDKTDKGIQTNQASRVL